MISNLHRPVSNRGQWRDSFTIYSDGAPDPSATVYAVQIWSRDRYASRSDYGSRGVGQTDGLTAATGDSTNRLVAVANGNSIVVTWLFPSSEMGRLCAGSYEGAVLAGIGDEAGEIGRFRFVVEDRGGAPSPSLSTVSGAPLGRDVVVIVDGGAEG